MREIKNEKEVPHVRIYYIYYQLGAMQQTDNAQRTANAPPYATARLPIPLTLCLPSAVARGYTNYWVHSSSSYVHVICEDIHLIQIWIALEDLASHITSFPISYQLQN